MRIDLNALQEKLQQQRALGVSKDGQLVVKDPRNNGGQYYSDGSTTLEPKRFFSR